MENYPTIKYFFGKGKLRRRIIFCDIYAAKSCPSRCRMCTSLLSRRLGDLTQFLVVHLDRLILLWFSFYRTLLNGYVFGYGQRFLTQVHGYTGEYNDWGNRFFNDDSEERQ